MDLRGTDLNLLVAFDALMAERSVTRAAERMFVGQSAMSASLARLRKLFDDPLLVREGRTLVSTPVAESMIVPIRSALGLVQGALDQRGSFDPATAHHTFTVLASDYVLLTLLRPLLGGLASEAPGVSINVRPIASDYAERVARGQVDFFVLPRELERSEVTFHSRDLFTDSLVCAVDENHPGIGDSISLEQFRAARYLDYDGGSLPSTAQMQLRALGLERPIDVTTQSFVVVPLMLRNTDFVTLIYERLGRLLAPATGIRLLPPPVPFSPITEALFWGERSQRSAPHRWLRDRISDAAEAVRNY